MLTNRCLAGNTRYPPGSRVFLFATWLLLVLFTMFGCISMPLNNPVQTLEDREASTSRRLEAFKQLGPAIAAENPDQRWKLYSRLAWSDRQPDALRLALMRSMREQDPERFWKDADDHVDTVDRWEIMQPLFDLAVEQQRVSFIPALVCSYARPSKRFPDDQRPEAQAIVKLQPDRDLSSSVWSVLISNETSLKPQHRMAAWILLSRLESPKTLREKLQSLDLSATQSPAMLLDLQAAAELLDELPKTREQILALMTLRSDIDFWNTAVRNVAALSPTQHAHLGLRHLPLITNLPRSRLTVSHDELHNQLRFHLGQTRIVQRQDYGGLQPRPSERYRDQADALSWGDALALTLILETINHTVVRRQLFEQADADHSDSTSEHGGVLTFNNGALAFASDVTGLDNRYVMPTQGILRMQRELAHYHFQVQAYDHADFAGPGRGDLRFAERFGCHALVFTFVDENHLNADFYLGDGTVIDLGVLERP